MRDYIGIADKYISEVLSGHIPACEEVIAACERQRDDLSNKKLPYIFDKKRAVMCCRFIELLCHTKGELRGQKIILEPWQVFIITTTFGWLDREGFRRFKIVYIEVPRKNGKSSLSSAIGLLCLLIDGEGGAEVYSAATTREQARIVFKDAVDMVRASPDLQKKFGAEIMGKAQPHTIVVNSTNSSFRALSRDSGGNLDGLNVHCGIIDEVHAHKTRDVFDVIETATGARKQPLLWLITTAGFNRAGVCYEQRTYLKRILSRAVQDDEYFGIIYTLDKDDDWTAEASWKKANPNFGVSVNPEDLARKARKAAEVSGATNNFLTKHLNLWVNADSAWMNMRQWDSLGDSTLSIEDFIDCDCWLGLDLASKTDIAALAILFKKRIDDKDHYYLFGRYWLPEDTVENSTNSQYSGWCRSGIMNQTDGSVIDFDEIAQEIKAICATFNVVECCYDPYQATQISTQLAKEGLTMVEVGATVANFSEPMKEFEALVLDGRLHHSADPCLTWQVSNVVAHVDAKENIYPRKEIVGNKIDIVISALMALNRAIFSDGAHRSVYEDDGIFII